MRLLRNVGRWVAVLTMVVFMASGGALAREDVAWERLDRPPFQFLFREESRPEAESLAAEAPRVLADLVRDLGVHPPPVISVTILPVSSAARSAGEGGGAPHWAVGFVRGSSSAVVLRGDLIRAYPFEDLLSLFGHEMTHVLLNSLPEGGGELPRWFHEGVAVMESRRWSFRDAFALGSTLVVGTPTPLDRLATSFPEEEGAARAAYAESFSFINFLEREHGPGAVRRVMIGMTIGEPFPEAFRRAVGIELGAAEAAWRDKVTWAYRWIPALTSTGVLWFAITVLVFLSRIAKRRRERALQEAWEREGLG